MNAKEYLEQAYRLDQRIDSKLMQVSALRSMVEKRASIIRKDPIQHSLNETLQEDVLVSDAPALVYDDAHQQQHHQKHGSSHSCDECQFAKSET